MFNYLYSNRIHTFLCRRCGITLEVHVVHYIQIQVDHYFGGGYWCSFSYLIRLGYVYAQSYNVDEDYE